MKVTKSQLKGIIKEAIMELANGQQQPQAQQAQGQNNNWQQSALSNQRVDAEQLPTPADLWNRMRYVYDKMYQMGQITDSNAYSYQSAAQDLFKAAEQMGVAQAIARWKSASSNGGQMAKKALTLTYKENVY